MYLITLPDCILNLFSTKCSAQCPLRSVMPRHIDFLFFFFSQLHALLYLKANVAKCRTGLLINFFWEETLCFKFPARSVSETGWLIWITDYLDSWELHAAIWKFPVFKLVFSLPRCSTPRSHVRKKLTQEFTSYPGNVQQFQLEKERCSLWVRFAPLIPGLGETGIYTD